MRSSAFIPTRLFLTGFVLAMSFSAQGAVRDCADIFAPRSTLRLGAPVKNLDSEAHQAPEKNPLFGKSGLPFEATDFAAIRTADILPAIQKSVAAAESRLQLIAQNKEAPNFQNTIEALEAYDEPIERVLKVFGLLKSVKSSPELSTLSPQVQTELNALSKSLMGNQALRDRVQEVETQLKDTALLPEQKLLLNRMLKMFKSSATPNPFAQRLEDIDARLSTVSSEFTESITKGRAAFKFVVNEANDLDGLPADTAAAAKKRAVAIGMPGA